MFNKFFKKDINPSVCTLSAVMSSYRPHSCVVSLVSCSLLQCMLGFLLWFLWFFTAVENPARHKRLPELLELLCGLTLCLCARFFCSFVFFLSNILSLLWVLHYPDPPRVGPASIGLSPLSLSVLHRLVASAHKERAANYARPLITLSQSRRVSHLHRDRSSQSGVCTGEDFDSLTQSQWEV